MRIISKFHDYYDCGMAQGIDTSLIYKRDQELIVVTENDLGKPPLDTFTEEKCHMWYCPQLVVLSFCGKAYPYFMPAFRGYWSLDIDNIDESAFASIVDARALTQRAVELDAKRSTFTKLNSGQRTTGDPLFRLEYDLDVYLATDEVRFRWGRISRKDIEEETRSLHRRQIDVSVHHAMKSPVLLICCLHKPSTSAPKRFAILKNPCLKDFGFVRHMDPFTAYQEIAMFLGGVMADADEAPLRVGSDEVIARQKGFDEWSFRTMPPGQKKLNRKANRRRKRGNTPD